MRIASVSHAFFAAMMIFIGVLGLIKGDFTVLWRPVPDGLPARAMLIYLCAFISLGCGLGLFFRSTATPAARLLLAFSLLWLLLLRSPGFVHGITIDVYWPWCQTALIVAPAWVLYAWFAKDWDRQHLSFATGDRGLRIARIFYGLALIPIGVAHFTYLENTTVLIPGWLPWHVGWAYFTGAAFMVAGAAVVIGVYARLAAALSALEIGLFTVIVWIPRMAAGSLSAFQKGETIMSFVLTAAAWVVADSYRDMPGLAVDKR